MVIHMVSMQIWVSGAALVLASTLPVVAASLATGREGVSGARADYTLA
jgi:hypothetical protein